MKKGFTLTETIVVIIILGIVSAILIPYMLNTYDSSKEQIIEIRNNEQETINVDIETNEIIQDTTDYKLVNVEYTNKTIYCYWERK